MNRAMYALKSRATMAIHSKGMLPRVLGSCSFSTEGKKPDPFAGKRGKRKPHVGKAELIELWKSRVLAETSKMNDLPANIWPKLLDNLIETIKSETINGKPIILKSFGRFATSHVAARKFRVPGTQEYIEKEAHLALRFRQSRGSLKVKTPRVSVPRKKRASKENTEKSK